MSAPSIADPPTRAERATLALLVLLASLVGARVVPIDLPFPLSALEAEALWALVPAWALLALAVARPWPRARALAVLVCAAHLAWALDWMPRALARSSEDAPREGPSLRIVSANLLAPRPTRALAIELAALDADVLLLQEVSDEWVALLRDEGLEASHPYRFVEAHAIAEDYFGIAIYSRFPIVERARFDLEGVPLLRADLDVEGVALRVYAVHAVPPSSARLHARWRRQMDALEARMREDVRDGRALVLGGDLNTSPATRAYRRLLDAGVGAAHEDAFRGLATTWPNGVFLAPPMRLDHVLVHGVAVRDVSEGEGASSDHLPVIVDLALPAGAEAR